MSTRIRYNVTPPHQSLEPSAAVQHLVVDLNRQFKNLTDELRTKDAQLKALQAQVSTLVKQNG